MPAAAPEPDVLARWLKAWVRLVEANAKWVLVILTLLALLAGWVAWQYASINSDLSTLIKPSDELRWYRDNEAFKAAFPELQQTAVVVVNGADHAAVASVSKQLVEKFRHDVRSSPESLFESVFAPTQDEFLMARRAYFLDSEQLKLWLQGVDYNYGVMLRLADEAGLNNLVFTFADHLSANRGQPLPSPLQSVVNSLGGSEGTVELAAYPRLVDTKAENHFELIVLKGRQQLDQSLPNAAIVAAVRQVVSEVAVPASVSVRLTGEVALAHEELTAALSGVGLAGSVSLILLAIILGFGIRSWRIVAAIFTLLLYGVVLTMGYATLTIGSYNTLSLIFVVMFFGLGVDFAVHFALRLREAVTDSPGQAAVAAVQDIGPALLLCMCTSMIAFLSFVPTSYVGLGELGIISAGGMVIAFLLTLTLLPALFAWLGPPVAELTVKQKPSLMPELPVVPTLALVFIATIIAGYIAKDLRFDYSVLAMRDANTEGMQTLLALQEADLTTDYSISVLVDDAAHAARVKAALETLSTVGSVNTPGDYLPADQVSKSAQLTSTLETYASIEEVLPAEEPELYSEAIDYLVEKRQYVREADLPAFDQMISRLRSLVGQSEAITRIDARILSEVRKELTDLRALLGATPFTFEDVPDDFRRRLFTAGGRHLLSVQPTERLDSRVATGEFIRDVQQAAPNIAGRSVVEWGVGEVVVESFQVAASLAFATILVLLVIYFRNLVLPVLVLVPVCLALLFTFAICQLSGLSLNMANILVVPLIIGLGVDTGIHVVHRFTHAHEVEQVYRSSTARAVLISALTTIGTFFSLSFSPHHGAASVGLLLTIAISLMLLATFLVLPVLLRVFARFQQVPGSGLP